MKKIITTFIVLASLLATPAMAHDNRDRRQNDRGGGDWIVPLIGGVIIGVIVSDRNDRNRRNENRGSRDRDPYYYDQYTMPDQAQYYEHYCVTEQMRDIYGRLYYRRTCQ